MADVEHTHKGDEPTEAITEHLARKHGYHRSILDTPYDEMSALVMEHRALHADARGPSR